MPPKSRKPGPNDTPMFDVEPKVEHGYHPEPGDTPRTTTEFTVRDFDNQPPVSQPAIPTQPEVIYGEPGTYMDVRERAKKLQVLIPRIAQYAKREKLPAGIHTEEGPDIQARLEREGKPVMKRLREVEQHKEEVKQEINNFLYKALGYEAVGKVYPEFAPTMRRDASQDRYRMIQRYGARKGKEREAFQTQLDVHAPRPKKPRKR